MDFGEIFYNGLAWLKDQGFLDLDQCLDPEVFKNCLWLKFFRGLGHGPRKNCLDFGDNPNHTPGPGFLIQILYLHVLLQFCRQPRIKHENLVVSSLWS